MGFCAMFQIGVKGEAYGKCLLVEWEWLRSFFAEVDEASCFLTKYACLLGVSADNDLQLFDERREWASRLSALRYSMCNYAEDEKISYHDTLVMMQKRYSYLSHLSVEQMAGECCCSGCGAIVSLFESADTIGLCNDFLLTSFLSKEVANASS